MALQLADKRISALVNRNRVKFEKVKLEIEMENPELFIKPMRDGFTYVLTLYGGIPRHVTCITVLPV